MTDRNSAEPSRPSRPELLPGVLFLVAAVVLCGLAVYRRSLPVYDKPLFFDLAAVLFVVAAGFLSVFCTAQARLRGAFTARAIRRRESKPLPRQLEAGRQRLYSAADALASTDWRGDWLPLLVAVLLCAAAIATIVRGWRAPDVAPPQSSDQWIAGVLLLLSFPLLVMERRFAGLPARIYPEGQILTYLLRLLLISLLGFGLSYVLRWLALPFALAVAHLILVLSGLVAAELVLRGASYIFVPLPPLETRKSHADSLTASLLRLQRPSLKGMSASMSSQFGIDLGRSWALGFIRRAAFPLLVGTAITGWLLSGITSLDLSDRAVYEAFGKPQTVFHSGLHVYLPWPFGKLKHIEYGVTHEIPIAFPDEDEYPSKAAAAEAKGTIEGPPPPSVDHLWEASRPTEASYLVAANENGRESFEVLNIDLRIIYRIGLSDDAALNAAYGLAAPDDLIRAAAGRMLARYFARYTISSVLGQNRENFIRGFQRELQGRLNTLTSSIDILGVVIETIHPPAGAAEVYQEVQASAIESITKVANAKGDAVRDVHQAQSDAIEAKDSATAQAAETLAEAKVGTALFAGDVQAYHENGAAFLFERRLADLNAAITPDTHLLIVDHRIPASQLQLAEMRTPGAPAPGQSGQ